MRIEELLFSFSYCSYLCFSGYDICEDSSSLSDNKKCGINLYTIVLILVQDHGYLLLLTDLFASFRYGIICFALMKSHSVFLPIFYQIFCCSPITVLLSSILYFREKQPQLLTVYGERLVSNRIITFNLTVTMQALFAIIA